MPHFFFRLGSDSPHHPRHWTHEKAKAAATKHKATLQHVWHDDPKDPKAAYVLVEGGDADALSKELGADDVVALHPPG